MTRFDAALAALAGAVGTEEPPGFAEWRRLFAHDAPDPARLYALHTLVALAARVAVAAAVPALRARLAGPARLGWLHDDASFAAAGLANFPGATPFDAMAQAAAVPPEALETLISALAAAPPRPDLYQHLVPPALRHALGEVYTPPRLAGHALDRLGWGPGDELLDPTCGSGVFLVEALRRRMAAGLAPERLLAGLYGLDINPLAVLAAKAALAVTLAPALDPARPVTLPVWQGSVFDHSVNVTIPRVGFIAGNPPWLKASRLPAGEAEMLKPLCRTLGLTGDDRYVGGIEIDLSALVTHAALARWLKPGGATRLLPHRLAVLHRRRPGLPPFRPARTHRPLPGAGGGGFQSPGAVRGRLGPSGAAAAGGGRGADPLAGALAHSRPRGRRARTAGRAGAGRRRRPLAQGVD